MPDLEFFYDVASPYSYLAAARIERYAAEAGVQVRWRPFLLGGVFKASGNTMPAAVQSRGAYMLRDLQRWAARDDTPFRFSPHFPSNSLGVMRVLTAADEAARVPLTHAFYRACWVEGRDIADPAAVGEVLGDAHADLLERATAQEVKDRLRAATEEAVARGAFGAPTFFVRSQEGREEMFFGNDRLEMALDYSKSDRS